jgi:YD repeat-containing protein
VARLTRGQRRLTIAYTGIAMRNSAGVNFGPMLDVKIRVVLPQGNALGFGTQSGQGGTNDSPPAKSARNADPVNTATGNYNYAATDLRVPGRGLDVEMARYYNSQDTTVGPLGNGWSHSFNIYLTNITSSSASVHYSDGKVLDYIKQPGTSNFTSSYPGYYDVLVINGDGTWTLNKTDQRNYQFDAAGKLSAIRDRNNNQISLSYSEGKLSHVIDTSARIFNFSYSGSLLTSITDPDGRYLEFNYDGGPNLISFRDAKRSDGAVLGTLLEGSTIEVDVNGRRSKNVTLIDADTDDHDPRVVQGNVGGAATNGYAHGIDRVLRPIDLP